ncbi:MAG: FeoA family protein [Bacteroidota bacterium]
MQNKTGIINSLLKMKNDKPLNTLAQLRKGEKGIIDSFTDVEISLKLLEMGCLPGEMIEVKNIAPFGDPIAITVGGYTLGLRKDEASTVIIKCI